MTMTTAAATRMENQAAAGAGTCATFSSMPESCLVDAWREPGERAGECVE